MLCLTGSLEDAAPRLNRHGPEQTAWGLVAGATDTARALGRLEAAAPGSGMALNDSMREAFARYIELLFAWNDRAALTAVREPELVGQRLFGESLALLAALRDAEVLSHGSSARLADIGSGGGFPGLPMKVVEPGLQLVLIEAQRRRCEFLECVVSELGLAGVRVVNARAEDAGRDATLRATFDLVVARAVAPLAVLVEYALPLLRVGGVLATPKGSRASDELVEAGAALRALGGVALDPVPLALPEDAPPQQVLLVRREGELDDRYPRRAGVPSKRPLS